MQHRLIKGRHVVGTYSIGHAQHGCMQLSVGPAWGLGYVACWWGLHGCLFFHILATACSTLRAIAWRFLRWFWNAGAASGRPYSRAGSPAAGCAGRSRVEGGSPACGRHRRGRTWGRLGMASRNKHSPCTEIWARTAMASGWVREGCRGERDVGAPESGWPARHSNWAGSPPRAQGPVTRSLHSWGGALELAQDGEARRTRAIAARDEHGLRRPGRDIDSRQSGQNDSPTAALSQGATLHGSLPRTKKERATKIQANPKKQRRGNSHGRKTRWRRRDHRCREATRRPSHIVAVAAATSPCPALLVAAQGREQLCAT